MTSGDDGGGGDNADGGGDDGDVCSGGDERRSGLDLVAPAIQVKRAVPPLSDGHWQKVPLGWQGEGRVLWTQALCPLHPDWKPRLEWLP